MKKITIFYREHHTSYRFAIITKKQLEEKNIKVELDLVNIEKESFVNYMMEVKNKNASPDIIYLWETESIGDLATLYPFNSTAEIIKILYPYIYVKLYSYEDRTEKDSSSTDNLAYDYKLADRIIEDITILDESVDYIVINKEILKLEIYNDKNRYWIEDYLKIHPECELVDNAEEGKKILKIIAKERKRTLEKEAEKIKTEYKQTIKTIAIEIDKLKNIIEKL